MTWAEFRERVTLGNALVACGAVSALPLMILLYMKIKGQTIDGITSNVMFVLVAIGGGLCVSIGGPYIGHTAFIAREGWYKLLFASLWVLLTLLSLGAFTVLIVSYNANLPIQKVIEPAWISSHSHVYAFVFCAIALLEIVIVGALCAGTIRARDVKQGEDEEREARIDELILERNALQARVVDIEEKLARQIETSRQHLTTISALIQEQQESPE